MASFGSLFYRDNNCIGHPCLDVLTGDTLFLAEMTNLLLWQLYLGESSVLVTKSLFFFSQYLSSNFCDPGVSVSIWNDVEQRYCQLLLGPCLFFGH